MLVRRSERKPEQTTLSRENAGRGLAQVAAAAAVGLVVANCSAPQQKIASSGRVLDSKYGVYASPRVIQPGEPVPKGGGRDLVGKQYVVAGRTYTPRVDPHYSATGTASWYGDAFHGRLTANGEVYDKDAVAAAHPTLPLPSYVRITNLDNDRSMIVRVNDRGPYHGKRLIDVSQTVAEALDFRRIGTAKVKVDYVRRASIDGSDDQKLLATLRTDGLPASLTGQSTMVARAEEPAASSSRRETAPVERAVAEMAPGEGTRLPIQTAAAETPARVSLAASATSLVPLRRPAAADDDESDLPTANIPLPPERPYDLGTTRASAPARHQVAGRPAPHAIRTASAKLSYAATSPARSEDAELASERLKLQRLVNFTALPTR